MCEAAVGFLDVLPRLSPSSGLASRLCLLGPRPLSAPPVHPPESGEGSVLPLRCCEPGRTSHRPLLFSSTSDVDDPHCCHTAPVGSVTVRVSSRPTPSPPRVGLKVARNGGSKDSVPNYCLFYREIPSFPAAGSFGVVSPDTTSV